MPLLLKFNFDLYRSQGYNCYKKWVWLVSAVAIAQVCRKPVVHSVGPRHALAYVAREWRAPNTRGVAHGGRMESPRAALQLSHSASAVSTASASLLMRSGTSALLISDALTTSYHFETYELLHELYLVRYKDSRFNSSRSLWAYILNVVFMIPCKEESR